MSSPVKVTLESAAVINLLKDLEIQELKKQIFERDQLITQLQAPQRDAKNDKP